MSRAIIGVSLLFLACAALAQPAPEDAVRIEPVAGNVHVLYGQGGNIGVSAGEDGVVLIDDQFAPATPQILEALAKLHPEPPRFVVNTHWHGDHTGGNENLAGKGSVIVAHDRVRERMSTEQFNEFFQRKTPPSAADALPVVTFSDNLSLHFNGDEMRAIHVANAHTDGDVFIHFRKANVIHTGDLVFSGLYPFVDLDSGGSMAGVIVGVDRMLELADDNTQIIPGHGKVTDRAGLASYRKLLADTSARMRELVQAGRTVEDLVAAAPFAESDATHAWSFITAERYVRMLYRDAERSLK
ncbi:MAG TPA: MBL fold metallo-hydrolase [Steroidobacteraceae bacterium]|nr:MBL fold metallo-hydrolase [Steroidobacteraceae bacterium]